MSTHPRPGPRAPGVHIARVPVDRLRYHPRNVRRELGDLRELTASIRAEGVLCPLMAHRHGQVLRLLHGHRRLAAAQLAGLRAVPVVIVAERDDDEAISLMLAENLHRVGLDAGERRVALRALLDEYGHTPAGLAARLGVSPDTVHRWAADPNTPPRAGRQRQRIPATRLRELVELWSEPARRGLSPEQAGALLDQLRLLLAPPAPSQPTGATAGEDGSTTEHGGAGGPHFLDVDPVVVERLADGEVLPAATAADLAAAAVVLRGRGRSARRIAEQLGQHERQVERWLQRHRAGQPLVGRRPQRAGRAA